MTASEAVPAASLSPGDVITEIDTPSGPWYTVLSTGTGHLTVDGSPVEHATLPVVLPVRPGDHVLRRERC